MNKTIRKPNNWQDFETLCKKLWGEIWSCPSIKKNGRAGQTQNGVDIYGIPKTSENYWGIQCKGKDDYSNAKLTETEILEEIEKAKEFKPALETFIIASTANKDAPIEEFVRIKNLESKKSGSFSIEIYFWEDIADLIEENKDTFNWYVVNKTHKENFEIEITINEQNSNLIIEPEYTLTQVEIIENEEKEKRIFRPRIDFNQMIPETEINLSFCKLDVNFCNIGSTVIEEYWLMLDFSEELQDISFSNEEYQSSIQQSLMKTNREVHISNKTVKFYPSNKILIQKNCRSFEIFIKPFRKNYEFKINWKLYAKDFDTNGFFNIKVEPKVDLRKIKRISSKNSDEKVGDIKEVYSEKKINKQ
ncbi:hypothetical protein EHQ82_05460 [Leptospira selangorensis]|uniref:Mrr-like domain-containing protein n=1 Tax=Leptospira selangorensis TaxID=2484982 RepID=A0ABY2NG18_9LEPT|nr:hypothetical protein [Leptospira selangorensis]TGM23576.1 hypothetical protein EHQ82_05460 [Leptospira selangorensis]